MTADQPLAHDTVLETKKHMLDRACEEFMLLADTPDAATLETLIGRYPEVAEELTEFAVEWSVQDLQPGPSEVDWEEDFWSQPESPSAVENAMAGLRQKLAAEAEDPFARHTPEQLLGVAARLGLDKTLLAKLRHRRLLAESLPERFCQALAEELRTSLEAIRRHLAAPPTAPVGVSFKADRRPEMTRQESFAEALERSTLDAEARRRWLD